MSQTFGAFLRVGGHRIDHKVLSSIQDASRKTGVSFSFLMAQAGRESAFNAQAANRRSSASGLYQFTSGTWMQLMKQHGATHGHGDLAAKVKLHSDGDYDVTDPALRQRILDMRRDPGLAAVMAGEYANDNRVVLEERLGRKINPADLYLAHFLGPQGATRFLKAMESTPRQPAANFVPTAAEVNPRVFTHNGRPADLATVYGRIRGMLETQRHYTHLEGVPAWEAMWTENISRRPQFASASEQQQKPVETWMQEWSDAIERAPKPAVETWVEQAADGIEHVSTALASSGGTAPATPPASAAKAARRLAEVATLVQPANAGELQTVETPPDGEVKKAAGSFHTLWLSLFGRREI